MMRSRALLLIGHCALLTCCGNGTDPTASSSGGGTSSGSGGSYDMSGTGGDSADNVPLIALPDAPGDECSGQGVCDAGILGKWEVIDRCDRTGVRILTSTCGTVDAIWQAVSLGGEVEFGDTQVNWVQATRYAWLSEVDNSCGMPCEDFPTQLAPEWSFLNCKESGGECLCEGERTEEVRIDGTFTVSNDGVVLTPREALTDPTVSSIKVQVCADEQHLMIYSEDVGDVVLRRIIN